MQFIRNVKESFSREEDQDKAGLVENVLLIGGFAIVAIAMVSWIGNAVAGQAANVATCIASTNSGPGVSEELNEECTADTHGVKNAVNGRINSEGGKFGIGGSSGTTPTPAPSPSPSTPTTPAANANMTAARTAADTALARLAQATTFIQNAQGNYNSAMAIADWSTPSRVSAVQGYFNSAANHANTALTHINAAQSAAQQALTSAQAWGNTAAITRAQQALAQVNNARGVILNYRDSAVYATGFSNAGGVVRDFSAFDEAGSNLDVTGPIALSYINTAYTGVNNLKGALN